MKAVILAGGYGTRIMEESQYRPKPMIEIGNRPILWHIMKIYSAHGINDFIICCGYKGFEIKHYFANYSLNMSDITFDIGNGGLKIHKRNTEPWKVTLVDTGLDTMTGGRLKRIQKYLDNQTFSLTYGDAVSDVNISALRKFHAENGTKATLTGIRPDSRFGKLKIEDNRVISFLEKPIEDNNWVNAGFFILEPSVFDYIDGDDTIWERGPLENLAYEKELAVYCHKGFWACMDTLRDKLYLEGLCEQGSAPWITWN